MRNYSPCRKNRQSIVTKQNISHKPFKVVVNSNHIHAQKILLGYKMLKKSMFELKLFSYKEKKLGMIYAISVFPNTRQCFAVENLLAFPLADISSLQPGTEACLEVYKYESSCHAMHRPQQESRRWKKFTP